VHLPQGQRLVHEAGADAQGRRVRAVDPAVRVHRDRELGPGHAAARPQQRQAVLRGQDPLHIRLGQAQALHALGEDVLRQRPRHRRLPQQADQGHIEALEEEAEPQERRSLYRERHAGRPLQSAALPDGQHPLPPRRQQQLPRELDAVGRVHDPPARRQRERVRGVPGARRLRPLRQYRQARLLRDGDGTAAPGNTQGRQADGQPRGRRSRLAAPQVRLLHEGHRPHVSLPVPGADNPVPGDALPEGGQQGDDQRRRLLDDNKHRPGRVYVLRGHGAGALARHTRAPRPQPQPQRGRGRGHARAHRRQLHAEPAGVVRRRRGRDDVQVPGEHALRRSGHIAVPGRVALDTPAHPGPGLPCAQRRHHLRDGADLHVHARARPAAALPPGQRDHEDAPDDGPRPGGHAAGHRRRTLEPPPTTPAGSLIQSARLGRPRRGRPRPPAAGRRGLRRSAHGPGYPRRRGCRRGCRGGRHALPDRSRGLSDEGPVPHAADPLRLRRISLVPVADATSRTFLHCPGRGPFLHLQPHDFICIILGARIFI
jgi:hypothetical protein